LIQTGHSEGNRTLEMVTGLHFYNKFALREVTSANDTRKQSIGWCWNK